MLASIKICCLFGFSYYTCENDCLQYGCFVLLSLLLALLYLGPMQRLWSLSHKLTAGNYYYCYKEFHHICNRSPKSALKIINKLRWRQHCLSPIFRFHWLHLIPSCFDWLSIEFSKLLYWLIPSWKEFIYTFTNSAGCHFSSIQQTLWFLRNHNCGIQTDNTEKIICIFIWNYTFKQEIYLQ